MNHCKLVKDIVIFLLSGLMIFIFLMILLQHAKHYSFLDNKKAAIAYSSRNEHKAMIPEVTSDIVSEVWKHLTYGDIFLLLLIWGNTIIFHTFGKHLAEILLNL